MHIVLTYRHTSAIVTYTLSQIDNLTPAKMQFLSLAIATLCAFAASVSAQSPKLYTLITSKQYGLNLTHNSDTGAVEFERGSFYRHWTDHPVTQGAHNWHCFRARQKYELDIIYWVRFQNYVAGQSATAPRTYGYPPSLFDVETDGEVSYLISLETPNPGERLAWTIERNNATGNAELKLQPYKRSPSQQFIITQEPGDDEFPPRIR